MNWELYKDILIINSYEAAAALILFGVFQLIMFLVRNYIRSREYNLKMKESFKSQQEIIKKEREMRTGHFVKYSDNYNFTYSSRDISRPGYNQELFLVYIDTDYLDLHEVIELEDGMELHVQREAKEKYAKTGKGVYGYKFRIVTNNPEVFVNPEMLKEGRSFYVEPIDYKKK